MSKKEYHAYWMAKLRTRSVDECVTTLNAVMWRLQRLLTMYNKIKKQLQPLTTQKEALETTISNKRRQERTRLVEEQKNVNMLARQHQERQDAKRRRQEAIDGIALGGEAQDALDELADFEELVQQFGDQDLGTYETF